MWPEIYLPDNWDHTIPSSISHTQSEKFSINAVWAGGGKVKAKANQEWNPRLKSMAIQVECILANLFSVAVWLWGSSQLSAAIIICHIINVLVDDLGELAKIKALNKLWQVIRQYSAILSWPQIRKAFGGEESHNAPAVRRSRH